MNQAFLAFKALSLLFLKVEVTVLDENDTPPTFDLDLWEVEVAEDQTPGETIMVITASDKDKEGSLVYSIVEGAAEKFSIDPAQGQACTLLLFCFSKFY